MDDHHTVPGRLDARYRAFLETVALLRPKLHRYCARMTGSTLDGRAYTDNTRDYTCNNWTSAADGGVPDGVVPDPIPAGVPSARLGHSDKGNIVPSWNSSHPSRGCSQASLVATGGGGRFYCFATN